MTNVHTIISSPNASASANGGKSQRHFHSDILGIVAVEINGSLLLFGLSFAVTWSDALTKVPTGCRCFLLHPINVRDGDDDDETDDSNDGDTIV